MYLKDLKRRMQLGTIAAHPSRPVKLAWGPEEASDGRRKVQTGTESHLNGERESQHYHLNK